MKRTCIRYGKSEYVRLRKNISEYCRVCQKYFNHQKSRIKKIQNHKCVNCGKNIKPNRCPHCNEIIDYKYQMSRDV